MPLPYTPASNHHSLDVGSKGSLFVAATCCSNTHVCSSSMWLKPSWAQLPQASSIKRQGRQALFVIMASPSSAGSGSSCPSVSNPCSTTDLHDALVRFEPCPSPGPTLAIRMVQVSSLLRRSTRDGKLYICFYSWWFTAFPKISSSTSKLSFPNGVGSKKMCKSTNQFDRIVQSGGKKGQKSNLPQTRLSYISKEGYE